MAESLPAIRVTDPQSHDGPPNLPQSPQRPANGFDGAFKRPTTPASRQKENEGTGSPRWSKTSSTATGIRPTTSNISTHSTNGQFSKTGELSASTDSQAAIDPLSQQILSRALNTPHLSPAALRGTSPSPASPDLDLSTERSLSDDLGAAQAETGTKHPRGHHKGSSFFSRVLGNKKKDQPEERIASVSEPGDPRPEGADAEVFSLPVDNIGYNPTHPQPPGYIKMRARNTKTKEFDRLFLAQELQARPPKARPNGSVSGRRKSAADEAHPVWAAEFSKDGRYLATAGHDKIVRVWAVIATPEERHAELRRDSNSSTASHPQTLQLSAQVFHSKPVKEFQGHESSILALSWSKNNFLLSSSRDKTVRLWHISRSECLCTFKHNDFVPSIAFHPKDDRFFLAGSLDSKLRLWSIPDKHVAYSASTSDMITAVEFTPDGKHAIAGCLNGLCVFYETESLKYQTQIHVRSAHGKNTKGSKITRIQAVQIPPHATYGDIKLLITSNDSRVRMYNFRDKALEIKFKGIINSSSQIKASLTDDHRYVCCGSEDSRAFIWRMDVKEHEKRENRPVEAFQAHDTMVTCVCFAPTKTRQLLDKSEDSIYDLCNPPPVMLMSRSERGESQSSSRPPSVLIGTPTASHHGSETDHHKRPTESAAQIARASHKAGNIIITTDFDGNIKVFRQDCAWTKRRIDNSDGGSGFMRRVGSVNTTRSPSIRTKGSSHSLRSNKGSISSQQHSDRIFSWRQAISSTPSIRNGSINSNKRGNRSVSPRKSLGQMSVRNKERQGTPRGSLASSQNPSATATTTMTTSDHHHHQAAPPSTPPKQPPPPHTHESPTITDTTIVHPTVSQEDRNPLNLVGGEQSNLYWNIATRTQLAERYKQGLRVPGSENGGRQSQGRAGSFVSQLSIDRNSSGGTSTRTSGGEEEEDQGDGGDGEDSEYEDAPEHERW